MGVRPVGRVYTKNRIAHQRDGDQGTKQELRHSDISPDHKKGGGKKKFKEELRDDRNEWGTKDVALRCLYETIERRSKGQLDLTGEICSAMAKRERGNKGVKGKGFRIIGKRRPCSDKPSSKVKRGGTERDCSC